MLNKTIKTLPVTWHRQSWGSYWRAGWRDESAASFQSGSRLHFGLSYLESKGLFIKFRVFSSKFMFHATHSCQVDPTSIDSLTVGPHLFAVHPQPRVALVHLTCPDCCQLLDWVKAGIFCQGQRDWFEGVGESMESVLLNVFDLEEELVCNFV